MRNRKRPHDEVGRQPLLPWRMVPARREAGAGRKPRADAHGDEEKIYRPVFERTQTPLAVVADDMSILRVNRACERFLGYPRHVLAGRKWVEWICRNDWDRIRRFRRLPNLEFGLSRSFEVRILDRSGSARDSAVTLTPLPGNAMTLVSFRDNTSRKRAEEKIARLEGQILQLQKMEVLGSLAGSIAHDLNNILAAVLGYDEMALLEVSKQPRVQRNLEQAMKAGKQAQEMVKQILTFSRRKDEKREPLQVSRVIKEGLKMLRMALPPTIKIRQKITYTSGEVLADPTQIHQVLMNLCTNAAHAMQERGGALTIGLGEVRTGGEDGSRLPTDLSPGAYLKLVVSDTGHGIEPEILDRIFEPYFTTKGPDEGTGIGLTVVRGIVQSLHGGMTVQSTPGQGTTFEAFFPLAEEAAKEEGDLAPVSPNPSLPFPGRAARPRPEKEKGPGGREPALKAGRRLGDFGEGRRIFG